MQATVTSNIYAFGMVHTLRKNIGKTIYNMHTISAILLTETAGDRINHTFILEIY